MFLGLTGQNSTGKTGLALSAPTPIVALMFDQGLERAIYGARKAIYKDLDIKVVDYPITNPETFMEAPDAIQKWGKLFDRNDRAVTIFRFPNLIQLQVSRLQGYRKMLNQVKVVVAEAIYKPKVATIVFDTATIMRDIASDAFLEEKQANDPNRVQLIQIEYGQPNDRIREIFSAIQSAGKNCVATHHTADVYREVGWDPVNNRAVTQRTGELKLDGLKESEDFMDVHLWMEQVQVDDPLTPGRKIYTVEGTFKKCGYNLARKGTTIMTPTWDILARELNKDLDPRAQIQLRGF